MKTIVSLAIAATLLASCGSRSYVPSAELTTPPDTIDFPYGIPTPQDRPAAQPVTRAVAIMEETG